MFRARIEKLLGLKLFGVDAVIDSIPVDIRRVNTRELIIWEYPLRDMNVVIFRRAFLEEQSEWTLIERINYLKFLCAIGVDNDDSGFDERNLNAEVQLAIMIRQLLTSLDWSDNRIRNRALKDYEIDIRATFSVQYYLHIRHYLDQRLSSILEDADEYN